MGRVEILYKNKLEFIETGPESLIWDGVIALGLLLNPI